MIKRRIRGRKSTTFTTVLQVFINRMPDGRNKEKQKRQKKRQKLRGESETERQNKGEKNILLKNAEGNPSFSFLAETDSRLMHWHEGES